MKRATPDPYHLHHHSGSKVTTKTTTELTITREKEKQEGRADIPTDVVLPEVELSNGESLPYTKLDEMLQEKGGKDASGVKDGTYTYTETPRMAPSGSTPSRSTPPAPIS